MVIKVALWALVALLGEFIAGLSTLGLFVALAVNGWALVPVSLSVVAGTALRNYGFSKMNG